MRGAIQGMLCVVEQPRDLMALEQAGTYRGVVPRAVGAVGAAGRDWAGSADDWPPGRARSRRAIQRSHHGHESDAGGGRHGTLHFQRLAEFPVEITRLARGITTGSVLEFANKEILADALAGRQKF